MRVSIGIFNTKYSLLGIYIHRPQASSWWPWVQVAGLTAQSLEDKLEQHEDAVGDFMKQWMELIHSKEAQEIGLAGENRMRFRTARRER